MPLLNLTRMNPILIIAAVVPAVVLLFIIYKVDRSEKEPPMLLLSLVLYGIFATSIAMFAERIGSSLILLVAEEDSMLYNILMYFVVVAFSEEGAKYFLLKKRTWYSPAFNYQFDGVVYSVFVSLGFALWENIGYVAMYGLETALLRAVTAVPGHACFGVFMGLWYGLAKRYDALGQYAKASSYRKIAFLLPAFMHGCYDYIATADFDAAGWIFLAFVALMFVVAIITVRRFSRNDRHIEGTLY